MANASGMGKRLGILLSGRGSNFGVIANNIRAGVLDAEIAVVVSNKPDAPGLAMAGELGLKTMSLPSKGLDRETYDEILGAVLKAHDVDLVVLAGYMRLLSGEFVRGFPMRIVNIHPSLLPSFPGLDAQHQAFAHGVRYTGCTVHFVDEGLDSGPIIEQAVVPVFDRDTEEELAARILAEEHRIYTEAIRLVLSGDFRLENRRVIRGAG